MMDTDSLIFRIVLNEQQRAEVEQGTPVMSFVRDVNGVRFGGKALGNMKDETRKRFLPSAASRASLGRPRRCTR